MRKRLILAVVIMFSAGLTFAACPSADLTGDCHVSFNDFAVMAAQWPTTDYNNVVAMTSQWIRTMEIEDFETGDFSKYDWQHSGEASWLIVSDTIIEGSYGAKSGAITHDQTSTLEITLDTRYEMISFYRKVSSESYYDSLRF